MKLFRRTHLSLIYSKCKRDIVKFMCKPFGFLNMSTLENSFVELVIHFLVAFYNHLSMIYIIIIIFSVLQMFFVMISFRRIKIHFVFLQKTTRFYVSRCNRDSSRMLPLNQNELRCNPVPEVYTNVQEGRIFLSCKVRSLAFLNLKQR